VSPATTALAELIVANAEQVERTTVGAVDVGFFGIRLYEGSKLTSAELVKAIRDAEVGEHNTLRISDFRTQTAYSELGTWLGDQGLGLALAGLGHLMKIWYVVLPRDTGVQNAAQEAHMINMGFVMIQAPKSSPLFA
jgi:hypothetical protein